MDSDMRDEARTPTVRWLLFGPSGRIGRQPYFLSVLLWLVLQAVAISLMVRYEHDEAGLIVSTLGLVIISFAAFISFIMLSIKRLHDMGYTGFWALLLFVPVVILVAVVAFLLWPSAPPNEFGMFTNRPK
jgi:uncharacterized membrane protein YhaH (DUF805 family)